MDHSPLEQSPPISEYVSERPGLRTPRHSLAATLRARSRVDPQVVAIRDLPRRHNPSLLLAALALTAIGRPLRAIRVRGGSAPAGWRLWPGLACWPILGACPGAQISLGGRSGARVRSGVRAAASSEFPSKIRAPGSDSTVPLAPILVGRSAFGVMPSMRSDVRFRTLWAAPLICPKVSRLVLGRHSEASLRQLDPRSAAHFGRFLLASAASSPLLGTWRSFDTAELNIGHLGRTPANLPQVRPKSVILQRSGRSLSSTIKAAPATPGGANMDIQTQAPALRAQAAISSLTTPLHAPFQRLATLTSSPTQVWRGCWGFCGAIP